MAEIELRTSRLLLRPMRDSDFDAVYAYRAHAQVVRYIGDPMTREQVAELIRKSKEGWRSLGDGTTLNLVVECAGEVIGEGVYRITNAKDKQAEIGLALHPRAHGKELGTELCLGLLQYGFEVLDMHRLFGYCDVENQAVQRMMARIGFTIEGRLRDNILRGDEWRDEYVSSILITEWPDIRSKLQYLLHGGSPHLDP